MEAVTLSGVQFKGEGLRTELKKNQFTVLIEHGFVTKGITTDNHIIGVSGELKFKTAGKSPKLENLEALEKGTLFIRASTKDEIVMKLTLQAGAPASDATFSYHVTKAKGAYSGTTGSGFVAFLTLFPSNTLGNSSSNQFQGSLT
jgi:hypothetical protein